MTDTRAILSNRFSKLERHFIALKGYYHLIKNMEADSSVYDVSVYSGLSLANKAVFDAYLKRFSSVQDYLGTKIFPVLAELMNSGITKMSEILLEMEKEEIIDSFESWIELRELRNALEHEYPDELEEALNDLQKCVDSYAVLEASFNRSTAFIKKIYQDFDYENI